MKMTEIEQATKSLGVNQAIFLKSFKSICRFLKDNGEMLGYLRKHYQASATMPIRCKSSWLVERMIREFKYCNRHYISGATYHMFISPLVNHYYMIGEKYKKLAAKCLTYHTVYYSK